MKHIAGDGAGPAIEVRGLWKTYGRFGVLRDLDLEVPWGQFLTILGPNGSGKTTLIKVLATLARPTAGEVRIGGIDPRRNAPALRRLIGVVTHQPLLYSDLTVAENLVFYARMFGLSQPQERIRQVVAMVGMEERLRSKVRTLSHGMQKRVSIARALLHDPPILLLDEPETGLDPGALEMLEEALHSATRGQKRTVVMTTHNMERGLALGDRVAILSRGHIAYQERRELVSAADLRGTYYRHTGALP